MRPEEIPILRGVENITTAKDRMHDELSAVGQSIDPPLSYFLHHSWFWRTRLAPKEDDRNR
jgi:hypothetical protein